MIDAKMVLGHSSAKWSKHQPDEGILWSNKLSRGVKGCDKSYIAFHLASYHSVHVCQLFRREDKKDIWQVFSGVNKKTFENIEEAKQFVRGYLYD